MAERVWTAEELRQIPLWWARAHLKDRTALELEGRHDVHRRLEAYEAEHARAEQLAIENTMLRDRADAYRRWHPCQHTECTTENALLAALAGDGT